MLAFSPSVINKSLKVTKIEQIFKLKMDTLGAIERQKGPGFIESVLSLWIVGLNEFIYGNDPEKAFTLFQIETLSNLLADKFEVKNMNIADISLIFRKAYSGHFGKLYGRLRPDVIAEWFDKYFDERCEVAAQITMRKHEQLKEKPEQRKSQTFQESLKEAQARFILEKTKKLQNENIL